MLWGGTAYRTAMVKDQKTGFLEENQLNKSVKDDHMKHALVLYKKAVHLYQHPDSMRSSQRVIKHEISQISKKYAKFYPYLKKWLTEG